MAITVHSVSLFHYEGYPMKKFTAIFLTLLFTFAAGAANATDANKAKDEVVGNLHAGDGSGNYIPWTWDDIED